LALGSPLAVRDLLACVRFALQPEDDLNLACLLVSPLFGWSQKQLYEAAKQRGDKRLWIHLDQEARATLLPILNAADMASPYQFLETILSGPMQGRRKLLARLGEEARDPIDALLNATLEFEQAHPPALQGFIDWFDRGEVEIKRDADSGGNAVRVMTVHGAKGLQAPLVILADAARNPDLNKRSKSRIDLIIEPEGITLPLYSPGTKERFGIIKEAADASDLAEREEHWRLLYVALTRAEERLVIGGALTSKDKDGPPEASWYAMVQQAMLNLGATERETRYWDGKALHFEVKGSAEPKQLPLPIPDDLPRPKWLDAPAPAEAAPARPLAPSSLGADDESSPPPSPDMQAAAERGRLLHGLFERLPSLPPEQRESAALRWLKTSGASDPQALARDALAVIENPAFAAIFAPDALAEAPLAGVVDTLVISGTVDRLLVSETEVLVVDFKTGRRVPSRIENAPTSHLRQMSAYVALLRSIFPGKTVKAGLLYTHEARMLQLPDALLEAHKPSLQAQQDILLRAS
jgi:ATP-dependent helicase/nuclease subunit A